MTTHSPLEHPPEGRARVSERRWAVVTLGAMALVTLLAFFAIRTLSRSQPPAPAAPVDHGPLPQSVRQAVMDLLAPHLDHARLVELPGDGIREFRIKGRPKAVLAKEFNAAFKPLVVRELMPRLRPYGEILSFEIESLDLPPARLRPL